MNLNGNLARYVSADTANQDWVASPSGTVFRKRVHLVGPAESGQVTSIVRYQPGATFPGHEHPDGEEILVLDGVFSDEHGDWPAGTFLLNPEGFSHAPFSKEGCLLFVKLRQYAGDKREHHAIATNDLDWIEDSQHVASKNLYQSSYYRDTMKLERWAAASRLEPRYFPGGAEYFVLEGEFEDENGRYTSGSWLRIPVNADHQPYTTDGCTVYIKENGLRYLNSE